MQKRAASRCGHSSSTARPTACSRRFAGSASSSSTRSRPSRRRSTSCSGAGSARSTARSSTGCSGRSGSSSNGAAFLWPIEDLPLLRARMHRRAVDTARKRVNEHLKANAAFRRHVLRELEQRGPLLSREIEDHAGSKREHHELVGRPQDGVDARVPGRARRGRGRRSPRQSAALGPRRALVSRDGAGVVAGGEKRARREAVPRARRALARQRPLARAPGGERRPGAEPRHVPLPVRPPRPRPRPRRRRSGASTTGSRCTCRRRSASTATTCCRSCAATGSSGGSSRCTTARPACCGCRASGGRTACRPRRSRPPLRASHASSAPG